MGLLLPPFMGFLQGNVLRVGVKAALSVTMTASIIAPPGRTMQVGQAWHRQREEAPIAKWANYEGLRGSVEGPFWGDWI